MSVPKRVLVIGCSGNGKSTLTRALSAHYNLPAIHLDAYFWQPNWQEPDKEKWTAKVYSLAAKEQWVMDGNYSNTLDARVERADTIIYMNLSRLRCLYRVLKRRIQYHNQVRPDLANGCYEMVDFEFYKYIWTFNKTYKSKIFNIIKDNNMIKNTIILSSQNEIDLYLNSLKSNSSHS